MQIIKHFVLVISLLASSVGSAFGGQALIGSIKDFIDGAVLVAVIDVTKVTKVEVSTGNGQTSDVYVAHAEVLQTLKSDYSPTPKKRTIAVVGSTIPMSSAVWEPIKKQRYLAFLNPEQGHYRYNWKYAMRPISPEGKVEWIDQNTKGAFEILAIDIDEAIKRIQAEVAQTTTDVVPNP
ncbi:MAG: hypothetical protein ACSHX8_11200 [Opitutaceae bacterium]